MWSEQGVAHWNRRLPDCQPPPSLLAHGVLVAGRVTAGGSGGTDPVVTGRAGTPSGGSGDESPTGRTPPVGQAATRAGRRQRARAGGVTGPGNPTGSGGSRSGTGRRRRGRAGWARAASPAPVAPAAGDRHGWRPAAARPPAAARATAGRRRREAPRWIVRRDQSRRRRRRHLGVGRPCAAGDAHDHATPPPAPT